jgi:hypothetical protein
MRVVIYEPLAVNEPSGWFGSGICCHPVTVPDDATSLLALVPPCRGAAPAGSSSPVTAQRPAPLPGLLEAGVGDHQVAVGIHGHVFRHDDPGSWKSINGGATAW